jgi:hypothetical protein
MSYCLGYQGLLFTVFIWKVTATTGRQTIGIVAENVGTAWWGPCQFFSWCSVVFRLPLPMQVDRKKWTSCGRLRSPDVSSADSHLWSHLVGTVYAQWCNMWDELWNAIEAAGMTVCNTSDVLQWTRGSWCSGTVCVLTVMVDHVSFFFVNCNCPDAFLFTVNKPFIHSCVICLLFFPHASCYHIWYWCDGNHIFKWPFLFASKCRTPCLYVRYIIKTCPVYNVLHSCCYCK